MLLGLGAGLFFTRGSLELMGHANSSEDVVLFVSFCGRLVAILFCVYCVAVAILIVSKPFCPIGLPNLWGWINDLPITRRFNAT